MITQYSIANTQELQHTIATSFRYIVSMQQNLCFPGTLFAQRLRPIWPSSWGGLMHLDAQSFTYVTDQFQTSFRLVLDQFQLYNITYITVIFGNTLLPCTEVIDSTLVLRWVFSFEYYMEIYFFWSEIRLCVMFKRLLAWYMSIRKRSFQSDLEFLNDSHITLLLKQEFLFRVHHHQLEVSKMHNGSHIYVAKLNSHLTERLWNFGCQRHCRLCDIVLPW